MLKRAGTSLPVTGAAGRCGNRRSAAKPSRAWREILLGEGWQHFRMSWNARTGGRVPGSTRETSMKKQVKKLVLSKETVRSLNLEPGEAVGGSGTIDCSVSTDYRYCPREPATRAIDGC